MRIKVMTNHYFVVKDDKNKIKITIESRNGRFSYRAVKVAQFTHRATVITKENKPVLSNKITIPNIDVPCAQIVISGRYVDGLIHCYSYTLGDLETMLVGVVKMDIDFNHLFSVAKKQVIADLRKFMVSDEAQHPYQFPHLQPKLKKLRARLKNDEASRDDIKRVITKIQDLEK